MDTLLRFFLEKKLIVILLVAFFALWGLIVAPFSWELSWLQRDPVAVDAIPDIGENQQIIFADWPGRSPQDVEDQVTYPLTVALLGVPGVKTIRSYSMFGFSSIFVIFNEDIEFYWSRSRILEKLNSLPNATLPEGVQPMLGPDATALGQVFWYTLEGRDEQGQPLGGWDLHELRSIQDWQVRYALLSVEGVSEVASIGGFVQEYQIDVDPDAMRAYRVTIDEVFRAVQMSNRDVGARTIEINKAQYIIRGVGFAKGIEDLEDAVVAAHGGVPIYVRNIAHVSLGPALRSGALDKEGAEAVGGVVVVRYGENPLQVIDNIKRKIAELAPSLPRKTLADGRVSQVEIAPFYDRSGLIEETLETLNSALSEEILVTIIVILVMVSNLYSSLLIAGLLPLAVLMCFIAMKLFGIDANIVALSGIAIAIGTMVDMGIVICENILNHLNDADEREDRLEVVFRATREVGSAVLTAVSTTVISFLPVFAMEGAEGKLFKPLAFTKTFALLASIVVALTIIPAVAHFLFARRSRWAQRMVQIGLIAAGLGVALALSWWAGVLLALAGIYRLAEPRLPSWLRRLSNAIASAAIVLLVTNLLTEHWLPLGPESGYAVNFIFVAALIGSLLSFFYIFQRLYPRLLGWCLDHKAAFMVAPLAITAFGVVIWFGFDRLLPFLPQPVRHSAPVAWIAQQFPGMGKEFMPTLNEGSYLFMPTTMPHASIGEALDVLQKQDMAISSLPEVETAVGKLGRADTPLDPAPVSMFETIINYRPEFLRDARGQIRTFSFAAGEVDFFRNIDGTPLAATDGEPYRVQGRFQRDGEGHLVADPDGHPFRLWRPALDPVLNPGRSAWPGIRAPEDIWDLIVRVAEIPGTTSAPRLQPIAARIVMLQSGMRAPMGIKIKGPDLPTIEEVGLRMENLLRQVPSVEPAAVNADRIVGMPYLEIHIDREAVARYAIPLEMVQQVIEMAIGGEQITTSVEGRERYPIRVRYLRELRDTPEALERVLVPTPDGAQIPLEQLAEIRYLRGPQMIKGEDTSLIGYVLFDMKPGHAEVDVVEQCRDFLAAQIASGQLQLPAGISYSFAGSYENQQRAQQRLSLVLPLALFLIFLILYFHFNHVPTSLLVFSGIAVAWSGGFIMLWLYGQDWFLDFSLLGTSMRQLFQVHPINLSVAVWVGFLALFGIASDDGVIMATYLRQAFANQQPKTRGEIRRATLEAGTRRVRPCLMTTATTILALIPVLTSSGRGADIMVPMAIPTFGGMTIVIITMFVVPVLYCAIEEGKLKWMPSEAEGERQ